MVGRHSSLLRLQMRGLQLKIPFRGAVGVVDQHQMRIRFQSLRLLGNRLGILRNEARAQNSNDESNHWNKSKDVPRSAEIQPAQIAANRSDNCATGKPQASGPNLLEAIAGKREIDGGGDGRAGDELQDLVRQTVRRRRMRAHAKAAWNRLE